MTEIDKQIKEIGYEERVVDLICQYIVYENKDKDTEITIEWDVEDEYCLIFVNSITRQKDWFGQPYQEPMGVSCKEYELFIAKIKEMKNYERA